MTAMLGSQSPDQNHISNADAATNAGFADLRSLRRALSQTYGVTMKSIHANQIPPGDYLTAEIREGE